MYHLANPFFLRITTASDKFSQLLQINVNQFQTQHGEAKTDE